MEFKVKKIVWYDHVDIEDGYIDIYTQEKYYQ